MLFAGNADLVDRHRVGVWLNTGRRNTRSEQGAVLFLDWFLWRPDPSALLTNDGHERRSKRCGAEELPDGANR